MRVCARCIYNETIPAISFDSDGVCNYCHQHDQLDREYPTGEEGRRRLEALAADIRAAGRGRKYDVVVGVSGGCDSSYLLWWAKSMGLRPLAVHFDNTWNTKTAVQNLQNILRRLEVDLFTHVVDNQEYADVFRSFLKASVPEVDTPTDLALAATHYIAASKFGIKYILEGHSFRTEGISPPGWFYMDARYVEGIQRRFGTRPLKTLPSLWLPKWLKWIAVDGIRKIRPLYHLDYRKAEARAFLEKELGWQWYGGHHMENRTAWFTNNYYLPRKFGIDLRYSEFSALVRSGQLEREEALRRIQEPKPFDPELLTEIKKRLALSDREFDDIMALPPRCYRDYETYKRTFERLRPLFWALYKLDRVPKSFYLKFARREGS